MYTSSSPNIDLTRHNSDVDHRISKSLNNGQGQINQSAFDWLLAIQVNNFDANNAKTSDALADNNLYLSISLHSAPKANLYAKPSDYAQYTMHYSQSTCSEHCSTRLNFFNALCPLSLHWQSDSQPVSDEVIDNLPWHKQQVVKQSVPMSINKILEEQNIEQSYYSDEALPSNDLADSLLNQIHHTNT